MGQTKRYRIAMEQLHFISYQKPMISSCPNKAIQGVSSKIITRFCNPTLSKNLSLP